ncbi:MAG TPA: class I SAM-dependent methyltransferase [Pyrinomonadaceae bacterium]|nr:class I SAM-dependent methyltransferase [Pyrinomonadaceae bacterium]
MSQPVIENLDQSMRSCEACGNRSFSILLDHLKHAYRSNGESKEWQYRLLECKSCGLGFVAPTPGWELLQTFYEEDYGNFDGSSAANLHNAHSLKYRIAKLRTARIVSDGLKARVKASLGALAEWATGRTIPYTLSIPLQLHKDAYILDVGYGSGNWLLAMSELGYGNLYGYDIEVNTQNLSRLRDKGINVSSGLFLENEYPHEMFDCIRLDHVFEHLLDPIQILKKCKRLLKPDGLLVMSFPCKNSWSMRLSLTDSPALQVPKHLYHHTQLSTRLMLEAAGFIPLKIHAYSVASQLGGTVNKMLEERNSRRIPLLVFEMASPVYKLFGALTGKGDFMTVWAK